MEAFDREVSFASTDKSLLAFYNMANRSELIDGIDPIANHSALDESLGDIQNIALLRPSFLDSPGGPGPGNFQKNTPHKEVKVQTILQITSEDVLITNPVFQVPSNCLQTVAFMAPIREALFLARTFLEVPPQLVIDPFVMSGKHLFFLEFNEKGAVVGDFPGDEAFFSISLDFLRDAAVHIVFGALDRLGVTFYTPRPVSNMHPHHDFSADGPGLNLGVTSDPSSLLFSQSIIHRVEEIDFRRPVKSATSSKKTAAQIMNMCLEVGPIRRIRFRLFESSVMMYLENFIRQDRWDEAVKILKSHKRGFAAELRQQMDLKLKFKNELTKELQRLFKQHDCPHINLSAISEFKSCKLEHPQLRELKDKLIPTVHLKSFREFLAQWNVFVNRIIRSPGNQQQEIDGLLKSLRTGIEAYTRCADNCINVGELLRSFKDKKILKALDKTELFWIHKPENFDAHISKFRQNYAEKKAATQAAKVHYLRSAFEKIDHLIEKKESVMVATLVLQFYQVVLQEDDADLRFKVVKLNKKIEQKFKRAEKLVVKSVRRTGEDSVAVEVASSPGRPSELFCFRQRPGVPWEYDRVHHELDFLVFTHENSCETRIFKKANNQGTVSDVHEIGEANLPNLGDSINGLDPPESYAGRSSIQSLAQGGGQSLNESSSLQTVQRSDQFQTTQFIWRQSMSESFQPFPINLMTTEILKCHEPDDIILLDQQNERVSIPGDSKKLRAAKEMVLNNVRYLLLVFVDTIEVLRLTPLPPDHPAITRTPVVDRMRPFWSFFKECFYDEAEFRNSALDLVHFMVDDLTGRALTVERCLRKIGFFGTTDNKMPKELREGLFIFFRSHLSFLGGVLPGQESPPDLPAALERIPIKRGVVQMAPQVCQPTIPISSVSSQDRTLKTLGVKGSLS